MGAPEGPRRFLLQPVPEGQPQPDKRGKAPPFPGVFHGYDKPV
jgi:hypothetical protein